MLDMGFIRDVRKIVAALPRQRQTIFLSATMPKAVAGLARITSYNVCYTKLLRTWPPLLPAIGTFRAVQGIEIAPEVDGIVTALHFDSGEETETGALLVELDDLVERSDLKAAEAELKKTSLDSYNFV